jgi:prophage regulatory protein
MGEKKEANMADKHRHQTKSVVERRTANQRDEIRFLLGYLERLRRWHADWFDLLPCDLSEQSEEDRLEYEAEAERTARLADASGFDGSLFRDFLREDPNEDPLSARRHRRLGQQIETLARIIAKLDASASSETAIPSEAKLLSVAQVARMLTCGESTLREQDRKGLVPSPVRRGGSLRWNVDELNAWLKSGCPERGEWERLRDKVMEEVRNGTA